MICIYFFVDEVDEIEVYGSEAQSGTQLATYSFEVSEWIYSTFPYLPLEQDDLHVWLICRFVTAYSTLGLVQTPPWGNRPFSLKRYKQNTIYTLIVTDPTSNLFSYACSIHVLHSRAYLRCCPQFQSNPEPDLEVVVCSGHGKNGALSVLQVTPLPGFTVDFKCLHV